MKKFVALLIVGLILPLVGETRAEELIKTDLRTGTVFTNAIAPTVTITNSTKTISLVKADPTGAVGLQVQLSASNAEPSNTVFKIKRGLDSNFETTPGITWTIPLPGTASITNTYYTNIVVGPCTALLPFTITQQSTNGTVTIVNFGAGTKPR